jgi:putative Mg2+ transporter-C (MgtC) family protein
MQAIWTAFLNQDIGVPLVSSIVTGMLIGAERELRNKSAGLRTHTLVCFASTLLMFAATRQGEWTTDFIPGGQVVADPTRMAHGVLTGIGFLCAGVIFREGPSVHGLTTAASLWMAAALGLLYGIGMYWLALAGTASTLAVLVLFRLFYRVLPSGIKAAVAVRCGDATCDAAALRRLLHAEGFRAAPIAQRWRSDGAGGELATEVALRDEAEGDRLGAVLAAAPGIVGFRIVPTEDIAPHAARW